MKTCTKCGIPKKPNLFFKDKQKKDGLRSVCKKCHSANNRAYDITPAGKAVKRAASRKYSASEKGKEKNKEWTQSEEGKIAVCKASKRSRLKYPEKAKARSVVSGAIRSGKLTKHPCSACGETKVEAHHPSYSEPLEIMWLCVGCHKQWHKNHGEII